MNKIAKGAVALLAGMALPLAMGGTAARAQEPVEQNPFAVKVGIYFATDKDARSAGGNAMLAVDAEYTLQTLVENAGSLSHTHLSIGYSGREDLRIIPITISQTFRDVRAAPGTGYYYGLGLGIYITSLDAPDTSGQTKNLFGGFAVGGMNINQTTFAELKYHLISNYDNKNVSGFQLSIGTKF